MKTITQSELVTRLMETDASASFVSIRSETDPRLKRTGNPFNAGAVLKRSATRGLINFRYTNAVNNQRDREGIDEAFEAQPRRWGVHVPDTPLIEHKGAFYIEMKVEGITEDPVFFNAVTGVEIAKPEIEEWLPARRKAQTQGTETEVVVRDFKVASIRGITMYGEEFEVIEDENA